MSYTTPACFSNFFFYLLLFLLYLKIPNFLLQLFLNFFGNNYYDYDYGYYITTHIVAPCAPGISIIIWKENTLLPAVFNLLYSSTNQQLLKKNLCNQSGHYENHRWFSLLMEAITCTPQNWYFCGEKRWMEQKGGH